VVTIIGAPRTGTGPIFAAPLRRSQIEDRLRRLPRTLRHQRAGHSSVGLVPVPASPLGRGNRPSGSRDELTPPPCPGLGYPAASTSRPRRMGPLARRGETSRPIRSIAWRWSWRVSSEASHPGGEEGPANAVSTRGECGAVGCHRARLAAGDSLTGSQGTSLPMRCST